MSVADAAAVVLDVVMDLVLDVSLAVVVDHVDVTDVVEDDALDVMLAVLLDESLRAQHELPKPLEELRRLPAAHNAWLQSTSAMRHG